MASEIMFKLPVTSFGPVKKQRALDISADITVPRFPNITCNNSCDNVKCVHRISVIIQLEQNIRFLQEQHHLMLTGLHKEIENLRNLNRDLQFQLIFAKGNLPSSPSSPEDDSKPKLISSPKQINVIPLQVEILEKELGELKLQLNETECRNTYLSAITEEQKKKLERYERDREKEREKSNPQDPELLRKLDEAEAIIRELRRQNSDLRRENSISGASNLNLVEASTSQKLFTDGKSHSRHRGSRSTNYRGNWFPPLHTQTFWQHENIQERNCNAYQTTLPRLPQNRSKPSRHQNKRVTSNSNGHYQNGGRSSQGAGCFSKSPKPE